MKKNETSKHSGQTIIEVMVAMFVLTTGFLGITSLLAQSLSISKNLSNQTTATYLAAEGVELVKNVIDHDMYQHLAGLGTGWGTAFGAGGDFQMDYSTCNNLANPAAPCNPPPYTAVPLSYDVNSHLYSYSGSIPTNFTRKITVTPIGAAEIAVFSKVSWLVGSATQSITLEDHFYNWHP
jgi:Prokaryotic N-terminal methylation motif